MATWTNGKTGTVHSTMSEGIRWIIANVKGIVTKDDKGNSMIDVKIAEKYCKESGMDCYRILSTFKNDQEKNIATDKKTGMTIKAIEARKIADLKKKAEDKKESAKNAAIPETAKTEKKLPKVTGNKKSAKKSVKKDNAAIPENPEMLTNEDLINSIIGKTEEIQEIPENDAAMIAALKDMETETTI